MSSSQDTPRIIEALDRGADDFTEKSPRIEELVARLRVAERFLKAQHNLIRLATIDPLSGLYNRRAFFEEAARSSVVAEATRAPCAFVMLDIDHFKRINDGAGHAAGDAVIIEVARRIQAATRGSDFVVRWGGEEFLAALAPMPLDQLNKLAERLLRAIAEAPVRYGSTDIPVTVSIGFANFPLSEELLWLDWERAVNLIDMALYVAKAEGRNRACGVTHVSPGGPEILDAIEADFHNACREGRVRLTVIEGPALGAGQAITAA
jgi:diguanylate cyclase (GGDEF)-like protein